MPEFHLFLPQMRMTLDAIVERAEAAEAAGFMGMSGMDHLVPPLALEHPMYEAMTTNLWLAAHTSRLRVGSLVLCDAFRHPAMLAREAVAIDNASGGRFELGIGSGSVEDEFATFGIGPASAHDRTTRLGETLEVLRLLWSGESFSFDGHYFTIKEGRQLPTPLEHIPIVVGGAGPARWTSSPSTPIGGTARFTGSTSSTRCARARATRVSPLSRWSRSSRTSRNANECSKQPGAGSASWVADASPATRTNSSSSTGRWSPRGGALLRVVHRLRGADHTRRFGATVIAEFA